MDPSHLTSITDTACFFFSLMHGNLHGYVSKHVLADINVENLVDLRKAQLSFKLSDEVLYFFVALASCYLWLYFF